MNCPKCKAPMFITDNTHVYCRKCKSKWRLNEKRDGVQSVNVKVHSIKNKKKLK